MKHYLKLFFILASVALLATTPAQAENEEKMVIALKTDSFELAETDISTLVIGEAKTIETQSGKVIDILRTADGAEVYIDGEFLEINFDEESPHKRHMIQKHVEVICEEGEDCDNHLVIHAEGNTDITEWMIEGGDNIIIHKEIELSCTDKEDGSSCSGPMVLISGDKEIDIEALHKSHADDEGPKVILIKKAIKTED